MAKYFRRGKSRILWSLDVTMSEEEDEEHLYAPSREDVDGALDLSGVISAINGFELTNAPIPTPNLAESFTPQIEGEDTVPASSLDLYDDDEIDDVRLALAKGTPGFLFFLPYGDIPEARMEVWEAKSNGVNDRITVGNDPALFNVPFSISSVPQQNVEIPAAAP